MELYIIVTAVLFGFLGIIWSKSTWQNIFIKMTFIVVDLWAIYMLIGPMNLIAKVLP